LNAICKLQAKSSIELLIKTRNLDNNNPLPLNNPFVAVDNEEIRNKHCCV